MFVTQGSVLVQFVEFVVITRVRLSESRCWAIRLALVDFVRAFSCRCFVFRLAFFVLAVSSPFGVTSHVRRYRRRIVAPSFLSLGVLVVSRRSDSHKSCVAVGHIRYISVSRFRTQVREVKDRRRLSYFVPVSSSLLRSFGPVVSSSLVFFIVFVAAIVQ